MDDSVELLEPPVEQEELPDPLQEPRLPDASVSEGAFEIDQKEVPSVPEVEKGESPDHTLFSEFTQSKIDEIKPDSWVIDPRKDIDISELCKLKESAEGQSGDPVAQAFLEAFERVQAGGDLLQAIERSDPSILKSALKPSEINNKFQSDVFDMHVYAGLFMSSQAESASSFQEGDSTDLDDSEVVGDSKEQPREEDINSNNEELQVVDPRKSGNITIGVDQPPGEENKQDSNSQTGEELGQIDKSLESDSSELNAAQAEIQQMGEEAQEKVGQITEVGEESKQDQDSSTTSELSKDTLQSQETGRVDIQQWEKLSTEARSSLAADYIHKIDVGTLPDADEDARQAAGEAVTGLREIIMRSENARKKLEEIENPKPKRFQIFGRGRIAEPNFTERDLQQACHRLTAAGFPIVHEAIEKSFIQRVSADPEFGKYVIAYSLAVADGILHAQTTLSESSTPVTTLSSEVSQNSQQAVLQPAA